MSHVRSIVHGERAPAGAAAVRRVFERPKRGVVDVGEVDLVAWGEFGNFASKLGGIIEFQRVERRSDWDGSSVHCYCRIGFEPVGAVQMAGSNPLGKTPDYIAAAVISVPP